MPKWIHERAEHLLAKNPSMPKGEAFAIATQQSHSLGKSPKGYGTPEGRHEAKAKYPTPRNDMHTANPGNLETPKLKAAMWNGFMGELASIMKVSAIPLPPNVMKSLDAASAAAPAAKQAINLTQHAPVKKMMGGVAGLISNPKTRQLGLSFV